MVKKKLFRVEMAHYRGEVYVVSHSYDDAAAKGLLIIEAEDGDKYEDDDILDEDGSIKKPRKKEKFQVKRVELLTENLFGLSEFNVKDIHN